MANISSGRIEELWTDDDQERKVVIKNQLFRMAMDSKWEEVAKLFEQEYWTQTPKITNLGDKALHIAVFVGKEDDVTQLLQSIIDPSRLREVLNSRNDLGNSLLHSAASMGNAAMCERIATHYPELVGATNNNGDTPFVMAALHGEKAAFLCLHYICVYNVGLDGYWYSRRKNGDTILHCAIAGDYFDLAFQIIHLYPKLASYKNEGGLSPLHLLASKPSAFRSGSHLGGCYKIIYHCILVDQLEVETSDHWTKRINIPRDKKNPNPEMDGTCTDFLQLFWKKVGGVLARKNRNGGETEKETELKVREKRDSENPGPKAEIPGVKYWSESSNDQAKQSKKTTAYPENYRTCNDFVTLLWKMILVIVTGRSNGLKTDAENSESAKARQNGTDELFPANYRTCIEFVKLASKAILMFLGFGPTAIRKIESSKQKHKWAVQIMNELLRLHPIYEDAGDHAPKSVQSRSVEGETIAYNVHDQELTATGNEGKKKTLKTAMMILLIDNSQSDITML